VDGGFLLLVRHAEVRQTPILACILSNMWADSSHPHPRVLLRREINLSTLPCLPLRGALY
jgi:hypothetical protein